nr:hypothetical protein [Tanacetum cinerariifolium]
MIHPQSYQVIHPQSYQVIHPQSFQVIHQQASQAPAVSLQSSADPIQVNSSVVVPYFLPTDDPLECLNKALTFMSTILALRYPSSNNQLETSSNPMHQVAMPERQTLSNVDGVEVYDSDCDDVPNAQPSFIANILSYGLDALTEVHNLDNVDNNMINQGVHVKPSSKQSSVVNLSETEITSDSNIISYSRKIALEKKIKQLDNIVLKRDQSAQTVHMLTNPQFFYDHTTKQALGFQNPFYLKKVQQLEPKLYDDEIAEEIPVTDVAELGQRMTDFVTTVRHDTYKIYERLDDAYDDRLLMSGQLNLLRRDMRSHAHTARLMESEARASPDRRRQAQLAEALTLLGTLQTHIVAL